jgi:hydrogenase 3 maturation protease
MQLWQAELRSLLRSLPRGGGPARVAVVGIGNETAGDDAAGVAVARRLSEQLGDQENMLVLDGGPAPENQTGPLRRFKPALVLLVDAAQMDEPPGSVRLLNWEETSGLSASTHTLPPYLLAQYLVAELECRVALLGIQPEQNDFGAPLSNTVASVVEMVASELALMVDSETDGQDH